jgi:hypothetical protein
MKKSLKVLMVLFFCLFMVVSEASAAWISPYVSPYSYYVQADARIGGYAAPYAYYYAAVGTPVRRAYYLPAPVVYAPAYAPAPIAYNPAPIYYQAPIANISPVVYAPAPVAYQPYPMYYYPQVGLPY